MKLEINEEMRKKIWLYVIVIVVAITIFFTFYRFDIIVNVAKSVASLCTPFILGFAIAFLLNKPMVFIEERILGKLHIKGQHKRSLAAILAIIFGIVVVFAFLALLIPQLIQSIVTLVRSFPGYVEDFKVFATEMTKQYAIDGNAIAEYIGKTNIFDNLTNAVTAALPQMLKFTYQFGSTMLNLLLGIMSGLYMLIDKERLSRYMKKINYAIFPPDVSKYFHRMILTSGDIFNNFIVGKAIDSLIIGIICYVGLLIIDIPYALLLAVIIGVTNMIPVFGPFIGAVPGIVILTMIHPLSAVYFSLFILALQQFDGNILGPLILGDKLGLPSIGILFSVCVGGGLFGVVGMFIGVPCFAVVYAAVKEFVNYRLQKKNIHIEDIKVAEFEPLAKEKK